LIRTIFDRRALGRGARFKSAWISARPLVNASGPDPLYPVDAVTEFVDPRSDPEPPAKVFREPAAHGEELRELVQLCLAGRVYDVERWIQEGRPIQATTYKRPRKAPVVSPLRTAIRKRHRDLLLLLLCNGYRLDLETDDWNSLLDEALKHRAYDILELLLKWGADPTKVRTYNVLDTFKTDLIDLFWRAGVDYTQDRELVGFLAHTVNKPLYGWLRRNRADQRLQDALDVALLEAVIEDEELSLRLLLWAGADPHRKVPMVGDLDRPDVWADEAVFSSSEAAITFGRHSVFDLLRIDSMPQLEAQASSAHDSWTLKKLVALRPPSDWSEVILAFIRRFASPHRPESSWDARDALRFIESSGGRLTSVPADQMRYLRRELLEVRVADDFRWLLRWLGKEKHCEPAIYQELSRTASVREKIEALDGGAKYLSPSQKMSRANDRRRRAALRKNTAAR
jgi:hypothetical protein